jgi:integrase
LVFEGKALDILARYPTITDFTRIGCNADTNRHLATLQQWAKIKTRTTFHTARHTCATLLCHQGVPITTVQKILGHTKLTTTQLYSEVMADTIVRDLSNVRKNGRNRNKPVTTQ